MVVAAPAFAQNPPRIEVDASDSPLLIRGFIGEEPELLSALRLHGAGDVGAFRVLFSDLKRVGGEEIVPRAQVSLIGEASLGKDEYRDVQVKVDGITVPGTYTGQVELLPHGRPREEATQVVIRVTALGRPMLTPVAPNDRVRGSLAHCGLSCRVTGWLVPGRAGEEDQTVRFTLGPGREAHVTGIQVFGIGDQGGHELKENELGLDSASGSRSKNGVLVLQLAIEPKRIPADHYTGSVHLTVENLDDPVTIPIDFSVRNEPYWALVAILVGILLGRLANYLQGRGRETLNAYRRARSLEQRVDREIRDTTTKTALLTKITAAREAIGDDDLDRAKTSLDEVEEGLKQAGVSVAQPGLPRSGAPGFIEKISPVEAGLGLGAHAIGVLVYLGLLIVGFQTLYVNQGTAFGSNGIFDYVGLVLWGLTADVASRGLGNLTGGTVTP